MSLSFTFLSGSPSTLLNKLKLTSSFQMDKSPLFIQMLCKIKHAVIQQ